MSSARSITLSVTHDLSYFQAIYVEEESISSGFDVDTRTRIQYENNCHSNIHEHTHTDAKVDHNNLFGRKHRLNIVLDQTPVNPLHSVTTSLNFFGPTADDALIRANMEENSVRVFMWLSRGTPGKGHIGLIMRGRDDEFTHVSFYNKKKSDRNVCISYIENSFWCIPSKLSRDYIMHDKHNNDKKHADYVIDIKNMDVAKMKEKYDVYIELSKHNKLMWRLMGNLCCTLCWCWDGILNCLFSSKYPSPIFFSLLCPSFYNCTSIVNELLNEGGLQIKLRDDDSRIPWLKNCTGDFGRKWGLYSDAYRADTFLSDNDSCLANLTKYVCLCLIRMPMLCMSWYLWDAPTIYAWAFSSIIKFIFNFSVVYGAIAVVDNFILGNLLTPTEEPELAIIVTAIVAIVITVLSTFKKFCSQNDVLIPSRLKTLLINAATNKNIEDITFYSSDAEDLENTLLIRQEARL